MVATARLMRRFGDGDVLSEDEGGDGDPLDVLVLGSALDRRTVVLVRLVGVLRLLDEGEIDDKPIAVLAESDAKSSFCRLKDVAELEESYPEAKRIIELWFSAYEGPGVIEIKGWSGSAEASSLLARSRSSYQHVGQE